MLAITRAASPLCVRGLKSYTGQVSLTLRPCSRKLPHWRCSAYACRNRRPSGEGRCPRSDIRAHTEHLLLSPQADRMLDMGFEPDIRRIVGAMPAKEEERQTVMFRCVDVCNLF